jgi:hypothetical protein
MNGKFAVIGTLFAILTITWLASVQVQAVSVGVHTGDTFTYKVNSASGPNMQHELEGADNFTMTVSNVTGNVVGFQEVDNYSNATNYNTGYYDLGNGNNTGTAWMLFDANLGVGDPIYPGWPMWANNTVTINGRPTGHTILYNAYVNITNGPQGYVTLDVYGDQATGAVVNASVSLIAGNTTSFNYYLIATNAWITIPEFSPIALVITLSTLAATTAAIAYRRKVRLPLERSAGETR